MATRKEEDFRTCQQSHGPGTALRELIRSDGQ